MRKTWMALVGGLVVVALAALPQAQPPAPAPPKPAAPVAAIDPRVARLKAALDADVSSPAMYDLGQQMNDMVFSFGEIGFQEVETQRYLGKLLRDNGFTVEDGVAGIPTAWVAKWGSGAPVIAFGSDIDGIPQGNQKPGVAYHDPMVDGAPGHGEGHNSGTPLNIVAAHRREADHGAREAPRHADDLAGRRRRAARHQGVLRARRACSRTSTWCSTTTSARTSAPSWGDGGGSGLVSVEYTFEGETAHSAGAPWRGRSALDAVELMNVGWNYRREHLRLAAAHPLRDHQRRRSAQRRAAQRQRLVLLPRDRLRDDQEHVGHRRQDGRRRRADDQHQVDLAGARHRLAAPHQPRRRRGDARQHPARRPADVERRRHRAGQGDAADDEGAGDRSGHRADRRAARPRGRFPTRRSSAARPTTSATSPGPCRRWCSAIPANFQAGPGHNWANAIPMATPIAHKGVNAGARVPRR